MTALESASPRRRFFAVTRPRKLAATIAALLVVGVLAASCSDGVRDQQRSAAISENARGRMAAAGSGDSSDVSLLFSIIAPQMDIVTEGAGFRITIDATAPTAWFTDRPERKAGTTTAGQFAAIWSTQKFDEVPPNAAVVVTVNGQLHQHIVELSDPKITDTKVSFFAVDVGDDESTDLVAGRDATHDVMVGSFTNAELFIDDGIYRPCSSNETQFFETSCVLAPRQNVAVTIQQSPNPSCLVLRQANRGDFVWGTVTFPGGSATWSVSGFSPNYCQKYIPGEQYQVTGGYSAVILTSGIYSPGGSEVFTN